jgi:PadR family transcriptional regulator, regulatory protein PadR
VVAFARDVLLAFARVHVLYHASEEPIFGTGMMAELRGHGYALGPGTIYPLLHRLEADGLLACRATVVGGKARKYYALTRRGQAELNAIAPKLAELAGEVLPQSRILGKRERTTRGPPR